MGRWLEHSVTTEIQAPVERVWEVWSDLEAMPRWMRWIESVVTLDDPDLTDWTLVAQGFRFHWKARITQRVEAQQLHDGVDLLGKTGELEIPVGLARAAGKSDQRAERGAADIVEARAVQDDPLAMLLPQFAHRRLQPREGIGVQRSVQAQDIQVVPLLRLNDAFPHSSSSTPR